MRQTLRRRPPKAFISYKWQDDAHNQWVEKFAADLRYAGIETLFDKWEVDYGESFQHYMTSKIKEADIVLFIITTASVTAVEASEREGGAVKFEIEMANARKTAGDDMRLIGIYREGDKTPAYISHHRYADFRDDSKYEQNLRELADSLLGKKLIGPPVRDRLVTEMVLIPAGEFQMGSNDSHEGERPVHTVYLDEFYMDIYEVTIAQYREFIEITGYRVPNCWDDLRFNASDHPVVGVTWHDAVAYAKWAEKRLPTDAEWEKAARGGLAGMKYPWGNELTHDDANYYGTGGKDIWEYTSPGGSFSPNGYGLYDMAGNVWEWCADWYDSDYYSRSPEQNPIGPDSGDFRVLRGGSWTNAPNYLRIAYRRYFTPSGTDYSVGFRCVSQNSSVIP